MSGVRAPSSIRNLVAGVWSLSPDATIVFQHFLLYLVSTIIEFKPLQELRNHSNALSTVRCTSWSTRENSDTLPCHKLLREIRASGIQKWVFTPAIGYKINLIGVRIQTAASEDDEREYCSRMRPQRTAGQRIAIRVLWGPPEKKVKVPNFVFKMIQTYRGNR